MFPIYCLMVSGPGITDSIATLLLMTARDMYLDQDRRKTVRGDTCELRVTTDFQSLSLGTLTGLKFEAVVETNRGRTRADFIISPKNLERVTADIAWEHISLDAPMDPRRN